VALTAFQRGLCRLLAATRKERESYVAGGVALNTLLAAPRRSRDVDLFHDTAEAVRRTVEQDAALLRGAGYEVQFVRQAPTFAEAVVAKSKESSLLQWVQDSAYRFFPLLEHPELGLCLHPFDLATNKTLAMAGRLEPRDWIDLMTCHRQVQPLGYLAWAACGKDPGFNPVSLLQEIRRASHYAQAEIDLLDFEGAPPDAARLGADWHGMLREAQRICEVLPAEQTGRCVGEGREKLCTAAPDELAARLRAGQLVFHSGRIGGAWPTFPNG
jgi:hypothetical protein